MTSTITGFTSEAARDAAVASGRISSSAASKLPIESTGVSDRYSSSSSSGSSSKGTSKSTVTYTQLASGETPTYGTKGAQVADLQNFLNSQGANIKVDSYYGPETQKAYNAYISSIGSVAPTNASNVQTITDFSLPYTAPTQYSTTNSIAEVNSMQSLIDYYKKQYAANQAQLSKAEQNKGNILQNMLGLSTQTTEQIKSDINPDYLAEQEASLEKIKSYQNEYAKIEAQRDTQIAQLTGNPEATRDFLNNEVNQIERVATPKLNQIASKINAETAVMTGKKELMDEAVNSAVADREWQWNTYSAFLNENKDIINKLDNKTQNAVEFMTDYYYKQYQDARDEQTTIGNLIMEGKLPASALGMSYSQAISKYPNYGGNTNTVSSGVKLSSTDQQTYEAYRAQISSYDSKDAAMKDLENNKFNITKAIGDSGYNMLVQDITNSSLPESSTTFWNKVQNLWNNIKSKIS